MYLIIAFIKDDDADLLLVLCPKYINEIFMLCQDTFGNIGKDRGRLKDII